MNPSFKNPKPIRYNIPGHAHELTFSCYKRRPFLKGNRAKQFLADAINTSLDEYNFDIWAYVFMPEHAHILIFPSEDDYSISKILKSIKQPVSRKMIGYLRKHNPEALKHLETGYKVPTHKFWQSGGGYDRNYWSTEEIRSQVNYIHDNPVRRGLVEDPREWKWSSVRFWETGEEGPVRINLDKFPQF